VQVECSIRFVATSSSVSSWISKNQESFTSGWCNETGSSLEEGALRWRDEEGMLLESVASMLNPSHEEGAENLGGSTRVKGMPVFQQLRIPMRLRAGELPAGAERGGFRGVESWCYRACW
jgi:hypothetical protein